MERTKIYNTLRTIWLPEHAGPEGRSSCLLRAIKLNSVDGVNLLLDLGAEVNRPYDKDLPLCLAARSGYDEIVENLLDRGAEINKPSEYGNTALLTAAAAGNFSTMILLLRRNAHKEARSTSHLCKGYTPLMRAVQSGHQHAIRLLVDEGAEVTTQSNVGESLLHVAIQTGSKEIIDQIFRLEPRIGVSDKNGDTELHLAAKEGLVDVCRRLIRQMSGLMRMANLKQETPLHYAVQSAKFDVVKLFLSKAAFPDCQDLDGKTPLHYAVEAGSQAVVGLLLGVKASPCHRDKYGKTPIHYAVSSSSTEIVRLLAEEMTSVDSEDTNKQTPLHYAVKSQNLDIVQILLLHKAKADCKDSAGTVPLEYVMEMPQSDEGAALLLIREFLARHEKGQSLTTTYGFPALSKAAREGRLNLIREICQHDPSLANEVPSLESDFKPPLHEAIKSGHRGSTEMLCLLPETDMNILDREGNTPLHQAVLNWQDGLLAMLICNGADKGRPHGKTDLPPLHSAAQSQSLKKVQELLNNHADPEQRVRGEQCSWCKKHNRPSGMNSRCVLQAIPEKDRTPEWDSINRSLSKAISRARGPGSTSTQSSKTRRRRGMYTHGEGSWISVLL
jgi:cytohesin